MRVLLSESAVNEDMAMGGRAQEDSDFESVGSDPVRGNGMRTFRVSAGYRSIDIPVKILADEEAEGDEALVLLLWFNGSACRTHPNTPGSVSPRHTLWISEEEDVSPLVRVAEAFLPRFGRTVAEQAVDGMEVRISAPREVGLVGSIGGGSLALRPSASLPGDAPGSGEHVSGAMAEAARACHETGDGSDDVQAGAWRQAEPISRRSHGMGGTGFLLGSSFALTGASDTDRRAASPYEAEPPGATSTAARVRLMSMVR